MTEMKLPLILSYLCVSQDSLCVFVCHKICFTSMYVTRYALHLCMSQDILCVFVYHKILFASQDMFCVFVCHKICFASLYVTRYAFIIIFSFLSNVSYRNFLFAICIYRGKEKKLSKISESIFTLTHWKHEKCS